MEYVYGVLLLHRTGTPIDEVSLTRVLTAARVKMNKSKVKVLLDSLVGVDIEEALKFTPQVTAKPVEEKKVEEKVEKPPKEEEDTGLGTLFK